MTNHPITVDDDDCPSCGGEGVIYRGTNPDPEGPCLRCGGRYSTRSINQWTPGNGTARRTQ